MYWKASSANFLKRGNVQLTPSQVRHLHVHLLSTNTVEALQLYVMILMGIKLFLRADELLNLKTSNFCPELFIVSELGIVFRLPVLDEFAL